MRPCSDLAKLERAACRRLTRLRMVASGCCHLPLAHEDEIGLTYVIIQMLSTWSNYSRSLYLSLAVRPKTTKGSRVTITTPGLTKNQALGLAIQTHKPRAKPRADGSWHRRDEPTWHDDKVLLRACAALGCSNISDLRAAVSTGSRVFIDLPTFRNFFAHRLAEQYYAAKRLAPYYGIAATLRPSEILASCPYSRPQALLLDWVDDLLITIELMCA